MVEQEKGGPDINVVEGQGLCIAKHLEPARTCNKSEGKKNQLSKKQKEKVDTHVRVVPLQPRAELSALVLYLG